MTYDNWKTTNPEDAMLGPKYREIDEEAKQVLCILEKLVAGELTPVDGLRELRELLGDLEGDGVLK